MGLITSPNVASIDSKSGTLTATDILNTIKTVDGTGSSLDADLLDGLDSTSFLRSNTSTTYSGGLLTIAVPPGSLGSTVSAVNTLQIYQATLGTDAFQSFHVASDYAVHFGVDGTTNDLFVGGWSAGAVKNKIWHAGNDGSGSGLDADLLDGLHAASTATANTIVARDGNGYIYSTYTNCSRVDETSAAASYIYDTGDGWLRKKTLANTRIEIVSQAAVNATSPTAARLYGTGGEYIASASSGLGYGTAIQIREAQLAGASANNMAFAPRLAFHWSGLVASSITMEASGRIAIFNNPGTAYENLIANDITGHTFISNVATGTAPLVVTSTTVVPNLNADKLDNNEGSYYSSLSNATNYLLPANTPASLYASTSTIGSYYGNGLYWDSNWKHLGTNTYGYVLRNNGSVGLEVYVASTAGTLNSTATTSTYTFLPTGVLGVPTKIGIGTLNPQASFEVSKDGSGYGWARLKNTDYVEGSTGTFLLLGSTDGSGNVGSRIISYNTGGTTYGYLFIASSNLTLNAPTTINGNLNVAGNTTLGDAAADTVTINASRIRGDFSNATIADRVMVQTSAADSSTSTRNIPSGTATIATMQAGNTSDPANQSVLSVGITATVASINSSLNGTGTYLPLILQTGGTERLRVATDGAVTIPGALSVGSLNGGPLAGFRNRIINGGFDVWQRTTSTTGPSGYTCADRWYMAGAGAQTIQKASLPSSPAGNYYLHVTYGGAGAFLNFGQALETATVVKMRGQVFTLSGWVKATGTAFTGNIGLAVTYSTSTDAYLSQSLDVNLPVNTVITPTTSWQRALCTFTVPVDAVGMRVVAYHTLGQAVGTILHIWDFQLEPGSVATPFEVRPIGTELALCQRYFQTHQIWARSYVGAASGALGIYLPFPVRMRAVPTANSFGLTYSNCASLTAQSSSFQHYAWSAVAAAAGDTYFYSAADAVQLSAEL